MKQGPKREMTKEMEQINEITKEEILYCLRRGLTLQRFKKLKFCKLSFVDHC